MKIIYSFLTLLLLSASTLYGQEQTLPAKFENNQIFIEVITEKEDTIKFLTDTGGGSIGISEKLVKQLGLKTREIELHGQQMSVASLPELEADYQFSFLPTDFPSERESILNERKEKLGDDILVNSPRSGSIYEKLAEEGVSEEAILGQDWFATRIWTFDYGNEKLIMHSSYEPDDRIKSNIIDFTFQENNENRHTHHMPRVQAEIEGETLDFLFDTGATTFVSEKALKEMNDDFSTVRGASYITQSRFEEWKKEHPDWKIIEEGEKYIGGTYIEVPEVTIAGHTVGPVWFATRPDQAFHQMMASMMDKQVEGALGGSLFQYFRITVNYPEEYAVFERN